MHGVQRFSVVQRCSAMRHARHVLVLLALLGPVSVAWATPFESSTGERLQRARVRSVVFRVHGMSCGHCASSIDEALRRIEGVLRVDVSLEEGRAIVRYDPRRVTRARLERAIRDLDYEVELESEA